MLGSLNADGFGEHFFVARLVKQIAAGQPAAAEDVEFVGQFIDFRQIRGDQDDAGAALQQLAEQAVDLGLGADVDAAGGFVDDVVDEPELLAGDTAVIEVEDVTV